MSPTTTEREDDLARVAAALERAANDVVPGQNAIVAFESPRNPSFGDFATNVALRLAKAARTPPQELATAIASRALELEPAVASIAQFSPVAGFLNVRLAPAHWQREVARALAAGDRFGAGTPRDERVSLEFGSANPTGPLVVVQGRTLSLGDALARIMRFRGFDVFVEWIVNDSGSQLDTLGRSLYARYRQLADPDFPFPQDGYPGDYLVPIARDVRERESDRFDRAAESAWLPLFAKAARDAIVASQRSTTERFGARYDNWQSEKALHEAGAVAAGIATLRERGVTFEADGALFVRATEFGDDKDRVVVRSDGRPTYYGADIAYHNDKLARADRAILILGPDHHGYIKRLQLIASALGKPGTIEVVIAQQMTTVRDGEIVKSSKRAGELLTLDDVLDEVGVDATRFFFLLSNADSPMTFDLTLAAEQSNENPVYYVQYGHARIASILRRAPAELVERARAGEALDRLVEPTEIALARRIAEFPDVLESVVTGREPSRLARYAQTIASDFTQFYVAHKVIGDDAALSVARLALCLAAKNVLASSLMLLGVSAPQSM